MKACRIFPLPVALLALLVLSAGGCRQPPVAPGELEEVVHPDLGGIDETARRQLAEGRSRLDSAFRGGDRGELADAFGGLGELYHAYQLLPPAVACYGNAERLDGESFLWPYYLGAAHQALADLDAAGRSLERALELRPGDPAALLRLGEVELARGDPAAAGSRFRPLLAAERLAAAAHFGLGRAATAAGDPQAAVEHFTAVLELQPAAGSVHHSLGMALRQLGRPQAAAAELERKGSGAVRSPDRLMDRLEELAESSGAYLRRGNRALMDHRLDEAAGLFRRAVAADPGNVAARRNLALALLRGGDVDAALDELREGAEATPEDVWIHFDLGNAYLKKGLAEQAVRAFRRAVELAPDFTSAHFNLANALIGLERWEEARPHLEAVLEADPRERRARYLAAMAHHRGGETAAAVAELRSVLAEEPANHVARQGLASILAESGQPAAAAAVYRQGAALEIPAAEKAALFDRLARLLWQTGQRQAAVVEWRAAVELQPDSSPAHTALANGLQFLDQRREARRLFARAVELEPTNATAWLSEARLWILDGEFATARDRLGQALDRVAGHPELNHTLARLLATCADPGVRDGRRALELARRAYQSAANLDRAETVAMALAEVGHFEEAIQWQRNLAQRAALGGDQAALRRLTARLQLYENRQPVRMGG